MTILGIDAGATIIKAARFSEDLTVEKMVEVPSGAVEGVEAYLDSIVAAVRRVGGGDILGVALPGTVSGDGQQLLYAANIVGLRPDDHAPYSSTYALATRLGTTSIVTSNDAACAALAEWQRGVGTGDRAVSLLHLTWGTGIGTAVITEGHVGPACEGGHMPVTWTETSDIPCACGSARDLEAFCAVPHVVARAGVEPAALLAAAEAGEERAVHVVDTAAQWLARGLHMMSVLVYPDVVTIGGGFMANDWLLEQVRHHVGQEKKGYLGATLRPSMVHRATLGNEAGMIGAAMLAKEKFSS